MLEPELRVSDDSLTGKYQREGWESQGEKGWNDDIPTTVDTSNHLSTIVPKVTKDKIWTGGYVNLYNFISKTEGKKECLDWRL